MHQKLNLKKFSFLVYGLGSTGISVIKFFRKKKIDNFFVWDDDKTLRKRFRLKCSKDIKNTLKEVDYIVLSPGISLKKVENKNLTQFKKKIITDIDLLYLSNSRFKSIVVTGTNGKSTTCKIISHLLEKNKFDVKLGGNIGTPILNFEIKRDTFLIIEASSFQLSHSQFIHPDYAILLNITNDHLDWHGSRQNYLNSKFRIFNLQKKNDHAIVNKKYISIFKKRKYLSKLAKFKFSKYNKIKSKIDNRYLKLNINDENMCFVFILSKLLKISKKSFVETMSSFTGLPHRYEVFLKRNNIIFVNDSKATSFQSSKFALLNGENIYWILGGLPKKGDRINLGYIKKNIIKSYIVGKNINFFKRQLKKNKIMFSATKTLKTSIIEALKDIKFYKKTNNIVLLSPGAASFDQFKDFENRGNEFKRLCRIYVKKFI